MKRLALMIVPALICGMLLTNCSQVNETEFTGGLWLKMGDNSIVPTSDIVFYDVSTHMIYLKKELPYLEKVFYDGSMSVYVDNEKIYDCSFHPLNVGTLPTGAYISNPHLHAKDIIRISYQPYSSVEDQRSDERIIAALKHHNQYHEGLQCNIQSIDVSNGRVVLNIELSNSDTFGYYYLDPDKMGIGLFSFFTNGPTFLDEPPTKHFYHQETVVRPEPWNSWEKEWLTLIKSGESKNISITYEHFEMMSAGKYKMFFEFPGLNIGISQKDLVLEDGRIWMGSIGTEIDVTIN